MSKEINNELLNSIIDVLGTIETLSLDSRYRYEDGSNIYDIQYISEKLVEELKKIRWERLK